MKQMQGLALLRRALLLTMTGAALTGCGVFMVGTVVGTAMVASDRRTTGTQVEDQAIETKIATRRKELLGERGHVNAVSYNRTLLLTGEVDTETDRNAIEQAVAQIENVRSTVNELAVMAPTSISVRSNDTILTSMVKASFVDAKDLQVNTIKVVSERGTVYLMGRLTEREAVRASELARGVSGVQKVVRIFDILTEAELAALGGTTH
jgi:osmotically-inducible protein OsmY